MAYSYNVLSINRIATMKQRSQFNKMMIQAAISRRPESAPVLGMPLLSYHVMAGDVVVIDYVPGERLNEARELYPAAIGYHIEPRT